MNEHDRATDGSPRVDGDAGPRREEPGSEKPQVVHLHAENLHAATTDDDLTRRITRALRSREPADPDTAAAVALLEARLAAASAPHRSAITVLTGRGGRVVAAGVVVSALAIAGAGAAAAANPYSNVARVVEDVAQSVGIEWSAMPAGYTRAQYEAFWDAGYTPEDITTLSALWSTDAIETKARAGQMILDGQTPPVPAPVPGGAQAPGDGSSPVTGDVTSAELDALSGAGYTYDDVTELGALWNLELTETKARAGQMILDGQTPPVSPSGPEASPGK